MEYQLPIPNRNTLATEVFDIIHASIINGRFEAGERLTESRLAKQLKTSRAPVREALRHLEKEGLLVYFPHRGYFVRELDLNDIVEIFELRDALEELAISLLISHANDKDIHSLEDIVSKMEDLELKNEVVRATELDTQFHEQICRSSGNKYLLNVWESMRAQIRIAVLACNSSFPVYDGFIEGHRAVLEAIKTKDVSIAKAAIQNHIHVGLNSLKRDMEIADLIAQKTPIGQ
jgi:DNA-binding GntR family transcriptional regulator